MLNKVTIGKVMAFAFCGLPCLIEMIVRLLFRILFLITEDEGFVYAANILIDVIDLLVLNSRIFRIIVNMVGMQDALDEDIAETKKALAEDRAWFR